MGDALWLEKPSEVPGSEDQSDITIEELLNVAFQELSHDSSWRDFTDTDWEGYYMACTLRAEFTKIIWKDRRKRKR